MQSKRSSGDAFISEVNVKVVSVISKETGFQGIQPQALDSFSNLLGSYIEKTLASAHSLAELGNRAKPNIHDITRSLENGGVEIATFKQYLQTNVNDTNTVQKTNKYFKTAKKRSTKENIPEFLPSDNEDSDEDMDDHTTEGGVPTYVPRHLPAFPNKHSFRQTPVYINRPDDPQKVRELNSEQSRTVEENLKKLMSAENKLLRQANVQSASALLESTSTTASSIMMPIVNYEGFIQRRKKQKQSGTTLNVEGSDEPKTNNNNNNGNNDNNDDDHGIDSIDGIDPDATQVASQEDSYK